MRTHRAAAMGSDLDGIVEALAPLPTEVSWLLEVARDPTIGADRLAKTISRDPALRDFLIRLGGSGYYGRSRKVTTLKEALVLLGNRRVAMMAFAGKMGRLMRRRLSRYDYEAGGLWRHSLGVAYGAAYLLRAAPVPHRGEMAATAGLLHDVGKTLVNQALIDTRRTALLVSGDADSLVRERTLVGFDHAEAGARLLEHWGLPSAIVTAVAHHHRPREAATDHDIVTSIATADKICNLLGIGPSGDGPSARPQASAAEDDLPTGEDVVALCKRLSFEVGRLEQITRGIG